MTYAILGYISEETMDSLNAEGKHTLHDAHRALHADVQAAANSSVRVIAHYRFRPPRHTTTLRITEDELVTTDGPYTETSEALRALYLVESDNPNAIVDFAAQLPASRIGATFEIWSLTEPTSH